jgi:NAD(P)-dependent dehydrogenase (short-subunit alcohol dehydrogenase family)
MSNQRVCCVIGAGDATGSAIARRFAKEGFTVCVARRNEDALQPLVACTYIQGQGLGRHHKESLVNSRIPN